MNKARGTIIAIAALCAQHSYTMDYSQEITTTFAQLNSANTDELRNACAKKIAGLLVSEESLNDLHNQGKHPALENPALLENADVYRYMPGTWVERLNIKHGDSVITAAFSSDGNQVATGAGSLVKMVDVKTAKEVGEIKEQDKISLVAYAPDNRKIVVVCGQRVNIYDVNAPSAPKLRHSLEYEQYVNNTAFSSDSNKLIIAGGDNTSLIYNLHTSKSVTEKHEYPVWAASFSPDNSMYMVSELGGENPIHIVSLHEGMLFGLTSEYIGGIEHSSTPCIGSFSPNSEMAVTGSNDKTAKIVKIHKKDKILELLHTIQHGDIVLSAAFSPNNSKVITTSGDKTARITDVETGAPLMVIPQNDVVYTGVFSDNGKFVATASADKTTKITNVATGETEHTIYHGDRVISAVFAPKDDMVVTASDDYTSKVVEKVTHSSLQALAMKYVQWCHTHNKDMQQDTEWFKKALSAYENRNQVLQTVYTTTESKL